ncbi:MAG: hypothetical protein KJ831_03975, partial [Candidatus Eisenbacteria bacterium]|nr:hypothetical protein [Candidatus Eisenbacteria bacterium]
SGTVFSVAQAALILNPLEGAVDDLPITDSLRVSIIPIETDPAWSENDSIPDSLQVESGAVTRGNIELSEEVAEFNVTRLVSDWITHTPINGGLAVIADIETRTLNGIRLASRLDPERGPRLRIIVTYSTTPRPGGK